MFVCSRYAFSIRSQRAAGALARATTGRIRPCCSCSRSTSIVCPSPNSIGAPESRNSCAGTSPSNFPPTSTTTPASVTASTRPSKISPSAPQAPARKTGPSVGPSFRVFRPSRNPTLTPLYSRALPWRLSGGFLARAVLRTFGHSAIVARSRAGATPVAAPPRPAGWHSWVLTQRLLHLRRFRRLQRIADGCRFGSFSGDMRSGLRKGSCLAYRGIDLGHSTLIGG